MPLLTAEEERDLVRKLKAGDRAARERMIKSNLRLVVSIAKRFMNRGLSLSDLIEEGNVGLLLALAKFDPERGTRFSTYAVHWIRQSVRRAIINTSKTVRIPSHTVGLISKWKAASTALSQELGRRPDMGEVADRMNLTPESAALMRHAINTSSSSDRPVSLDVLLATGGLDEAQFGVTAEGTLSEMDKKWLRSMLDAIDEREAQVLRLRYGLEDGDGGEGMTLQQVGKQIGVTRERVRQIEKEALERMYRAMVEAGATSRRYRRTPSGRPARKSAADDRTGAEADADAVAAPVSRRAGGRKKQGKGADATPDASVPAPVEAMSPPAPEVPAPAPPAATPSNEKKTSRTSRTAAGRKAAETRKTAVEKRTSVTRRGANAASSGGQGTRRSGAADAQG